MAHLCHFFFALFAIFVFYEKTLQLWNFGFFETKSITGFQPAYRASLTGWKPL
jgi:hypothetical protein